MSIYVNWFTLYISQLICTKVIHSLREILSCIYEFIFLVTPHVLNSPCCPHALIIVMKPISEIGDCTNSSGLHSQPLLTWREVHIISAFQQIHSMCGHGPNSWLHGSWWAHSRRTRHQACSCCIGKLILQFVLPVFMTGCSGRIFGCFGHCGCCYHGVCWWFFCSHIVITVTAVFRGFISRGTTQQLQPICSEVGWEQKVSLARQFGQVRTSTLKRIWFVLNAGQFRPIGRYAPLKQMMQLRKCHRKCIHKGMQCKGEISTMIGREEGA